MLSPDYGLDGASNSVPRPEASPKKVSRFKRPSWATAVKQAPPPPQADDEDDTFNRAKETLAQLKRRQAEEERVRAEKLEAERAERESLEEEEDFDDQEGADDDDGEAGVSAKRRKLNSQEPDSSNAEADVQFADTDEDVVEHSPKRVARATKSLSATPTKRPRSQSFTAPSPYKKKETRVEIEISSDGADEAAPRTEEVEEGFTKTGLSEEEPELSITGMGERAPPVAETSAPAQAPSSRPTTPPPPAPSKPQYDPALALLIASRIPNTTPLVVKRRLNSRLKEVQDAWLQRQVNLNPFEKSKIFFTWNGVKIFPFSSCKALGIEVNEMGEVYFKNKGRVAEPSEENAQIAFEAVTQEIVDQDKKDREAEQKRAREVASTKKMAANEDVGSDETKIKIILRGKGFDNYKLLVRTHTTFAKISDAFRNRHNIDAARQVICTYDGDTLDPDHDVQSLDVGQEDFIDMLVR